MDILNQYYVLMRRIDVTGLKMRVDDSELDVVSWSILGSTLPLDDSQMKLLSLCLLFPAPGFEDLQQQSTVVSVAKMLLVAFVH